MIDAIYRIKATGGAFYQVVCRHQGRQYYSGTYQECVTWIKRQAKLER